MAVAPPRPAPPWQEGCFWSGFAQPDIKHCEDNLCGWIATPANTWSNLAYLAAAVYLLRQGDRVGRQWGWCVVFVAVSSFVFHASYTFLFQVFDYAGMFSFIWLMFALNLRRAGREVSVAALAAGGTAASTALLLLLHKLGWPLQPIFALHLAAVIGSEALVFKKETDYRWFAAALGAAGLGFACWMLDYARVWCDPNDHLIQGHAAWHLLTALSFPFAARFYRQFPPLSK